MKAPSVLLATLILGATIGSALPAEAMTFRAGESVDIPPGTVIRDDLYVAAGEVRIRGRVEGDLVVAGGNVTVEGEVRDDLIAAGGDVLLSGRVGETIRAAGGEVTVSGTVGRDLVLAGGRIEQLASSRVGGQSVLTSGEIALRGTTAGLLKASGGNVTIDGRVGGAEVNAGELVVTAGANIAGPLRYTSDQEADIRSGAVITGPVTREEPEDKTWNLPGWLGFIFLFLAGSLTGLTLSALLPEAVSSVARTLRQNPVLSLASGAGILLGGPILFVILMITVIGIPLALTLMGLYGLAIFLGWVFAAAALGDTLLLRAKLPSLRMRMIVAAVVGVLLLLLLQSIPWLGGLIGLLAVIAGMGGAMLALVRRLTRS